jgi:hypothetical protein
MPLPYVGKITSSQLVGYFIFLEWLVSRRSARLGIVACSTIVHKNQTAGAVNRHGRGPLIQGWGPPGYQPVCLRQSLPAPSTDALRIPIQARSPLARRYVDPGRHCTEWPLSAC